MRTTLIWLLLATSALAAQPTDPSLEKLAEQRQALQLQLQNAQLLYENAQLKLQQLAAEEKRLKETAATKKK